MKKTDDLCLIENVISNIIDYIRSHKLLFTITIIINLSISALCFVLWYLYAHSLPEMTNTDKLSAVFNFFIAIGTVALAIFGYYGVLTYKTATKQYISQKRLDYVLESIKHAKALLVKWTFGIYQHADAQNKLLKAIQKNPSNDKSYTDLKLIANDIKKRLFKEFNDEFDQKFAPELQTITLIDKNNDAITKSALLKSKVQQVLTLSIKIISSQTSSDLANIKTIDISIFTQLNSIFARMLKKFVSI